MDEQTEVKTNEEIQQEQSKDWIKEELANVQDSYDGVVLESFKPRENTQETIMVDISEPWRKWTSEDGVVKKILPVVHESTEKNWWINVKNPIYKSVLEKADEAQKNGEKNFIVKILRTGQMKNTRYVLIK